MPGPTPAAKRETEPALNWDLVAGATTETPEPRAALAGLADFEPGPSARASGVLDAAAIAAAEVPAVAVDPSMLDASLLDAAATEPVDPLTTERVEQLAAEAGPRRSAFAFCTVVALLTLGAATTYFALMCEANEMVAVGLIFLCSGVGLWFKSNWLQFNVRTALAAMLLAALPLAWFGAALRRHDQERQALAAIKAEWSVDYHRSYAHLPIWFRKYCPSGWLPVFAPVTTVNVRSPDFGDAQLPLLQTFGSLTELNLRDTQVSDAGVAQLTGFRRLQTLHLTGTKATRECLVDLRLAPALEYVGAVNTGISREDAREFSRRRPQVKFATGTTKAWRDGRRDAVRFMEVGPDGKLVEREPGPGDLELMDALDAQFIRPMLPEPADLAAPVLSPEDVATEPAKKGAELELPVPP